MSSHHRRSVMIDTFGLISLAIVIGLGTKWYQGVFQNWVNGSLGGVVYEIFWCLIFSLPGIWRKKHIAIGVFVATSMIEFLQLWHLPFLMIIRSTMIGGYLLGNVFKWSDFLYYAIGCWLGFIILRSIRYRAYVKK
jgi:hypothetical protein